MFCDNESLLEPAEENTSVAVNSATGLSFNVPALPEGAGLQPRLDSIFADVQANLPSIDFEVSDVSSDEELSIFNRSVRSPDVDKHAVDKELSPETWKAALQPSNDNKDFPPHSVFQDSRRSSGDTACSEHSTSSSSSAAELQQQDPSILQIGDNIPMIPNFTGQGIPASWNPLLAALHIARPSDSSYPSEKEDGEKPLFPVLQEDANKNIVHHQSGININNSNQEMKESQLMEANMNLENQMGLIDLENDPEMVSFMELPILEMPPPTLDVQRIEDIDLDLLLDAFPHPASSVEEGAGGRERISPDSEINESEDVSLMDKLTQLCINQSGGDITKESLTQTTQQDYRAKGGRTTSSKSSNTGGRVTHKTVNIVWDGSDEEETGSKVTADAAVGTDSRFNGTQTKLKSSIGSSTGSQASMGSTKRNVTWGSTTVQMSKETVYMDLRGFDKPKQEEKPAVSDAVKRILQIHSAAGDSDDSSSSGSESEDDLQSWIDQRRKVRASATAAQRNGTQDLKQTDSSGLDIKRNIVENKERKKRVSSSAPSVTSSGTSTQSKHVAPTVDIQPTQSKSPEKAPSENSNTSVSETERDNEKMRQREAAKKLREQREQEKASRLRLHNRLKALRPEHSSSGKYPAAEATDVLFDYEASYASAPHSLPPFMPANQECVLLTAHLSNSGELLQHRGGGGAGGNSHRSVDQSSGLSATYPVLLTWLLSLVPKNFDFLVSDDAEKDEMQSFLPFLVVGLQQVWQGDHFALNIAIVPSNVELLAPPMTKKSKVRCEVRDCTVFQKFVIKFLSGNTLHTVCPWVRDVFSLAVSSDGQIMATGEQTYRDGVLRDGSYIPPLPYVSNKPISTFLTVGHDLKATRKVFDTPTSFFWQTVDSDELLCNQYAKTDYDSATDVQNTMSLVYSSVYGNPHSMNGVLHRVIQEGLDLSGVRLLYSTEDMSPIPHNLGGIKTQSALTSKIAAEDQIHLDLKRINEVGPTLALGLRGNMARTSWLDAVGPSDPCLARRTDPKSLMALFGGVSRDEATIYCPRQPSRVNHEMCMWFGGRVPSTGVVDIGLSQVQAEHKARGRSSSPKGKKGRKGHHHGDAAKDKFPVNLDTLRQPVSNLVATTKSDIFLTVAPIVPPMCMSTVLGTCQSRGFQLRGVRRVRLNHNKAIAIGLSGSQVRVFSPVSCTTPTSPASPQGDQLKERLEAGFADATHSPMPSTMLLLRKENAMHQSASLIESLMVTLSIQGMLTTIEDSCTSEILSSSLCFHVSPYADGLLASLGGDFTRLPEGNYTGLRSFDTFYSNPELEQIVVVTFSGCKALKASGGRLGKLLGLYPVTSPNQAPTSVAQGLELLGMKFLPVLSSAQAREITPYEVGDRNWQPSVHTLASNPALVCVVRGINAFQNVRGQLGVATPQSTVHGGAKFDLEILVAPSAETAFRQATLFFRDQELFSDPSMRVNMPYLPPLRNPTLEEMSITRFAWADEGSPKSVGQKKKKGRQTKGVLVVEESILKSMLLGPRPLNTVLVIKPYAVRRHLPKILKRTIQEGFTIVAMQMTVLTAEQAKGLLATNSEQQNDFLQAMHVEHLISGPVVALCLQRENAVKKLLDVLGPEHPQEARKQNQFLWRALYGADPINNALHGSLCYSRAVAEQKLLFPDGVCCQETPDLKADEIVCPSVDSIMGSGAASRRSYTVKSYPVRMDSNESLPSPVGSNHSLHDTSTQSSGVSTSTMDFLLNQHSALCQINCLLLTPPVQLFSVKGHKQGHIQVIDGLLSHGFEIVAARMVWFQRQQAHEFLSLGSKHYPKLVDILCHGPSIAIAVQRDNAVNCFESAMGSLYDKDSVISRYGEHILRPKDTKQASKYLEYFFDQLVPRSQGEILLKE